MQVSQFLKSRPSQEDADSTSEHLRLDQTKQSRLLRSRMGALSLSRATAWQGQSQDLAQVSHVSRNSLTDPSWASTAQGPPSPTTGWWHPGAVPASCASHMHHHPDPSRSGCFQLTPPHLRQCPLPGSRDLSSQLPLCPVPCSVLQVSTQARMPGSEPFWGKPE